MKLAWLRFGEFFRSFQREHIIRLVLIFAALACAVLLVSQFAGRNTQQLGNVFGVVESASTLGRIQGGTTYMTVNLDGHAKVVVELPKGQPYIPHARIELEVRARDTSNGSLITYRFVRYADDTSESPR